MEEPKVSVGILSGKQIDFILLSTYSINGEGAGGKQTAIYSQGRVMWNGTLYDELLFSPTDEANDAFELVGVTIGINFHWERKENQRFLGSLRIITEGERLTAINVINVEDYLTSVISSEMSATASSELLKAHAVISRSWLLASFCKAHAEPCGNIPAEQRNDAPSDSNPSIRTDKPTPLAEPHFIKWYERDAHTRFDVCADDHCQRYQGITRASTPRVKQAIDATRGELLMHGEKICDARFSKCCGGALEEFQYCWDDVKHPYLSSKRDYITPCKEAAGESRGQSGSVHLPDLTQEAQAVQWIRTSPPAFCNTTDKRILAQVLNNYDQETTDFYRWSVSYTQQELSSLILKRSGIDYGEIVDLVPIARGASGRIWQLRIVGTKRSLIIGKELEIRRTLSESHLYSSAFVVDKQEVSAQGVPQRFVISGAGWGHGVGLCQIGAAVMGERGYAYSDILLHYYAGATIERVYK